MCGEPGDPPRRVAGDAGAAGPGRPGGHPHEDMDLSRKQREQRKKDIREQVKIAYSIIYSKVHIYGSTDEKHNVALI